MSKQRAQSSTTYDMTFFMSDSADHISGKTGLTCTVTLSKNGGAFGAAAGAVTEIANGWYKLAGNATDRNTLGDLLLHATGSGADPTDEKFEIITQDPFAANVPQTGDSYATLTAVNTELSAVPASTVNLVGMIKWLFILARNKITQSATTQTLLANDSSTSVATSATSDDGSTTTRAKWS